MTRRHVTRAIAVAVSVITLSACSDFGPLPDYEFGPYQVDTEQEELTQRGAKKESRTPVRGGVEDN